MLGPRLNLGTQVWGHGSIVVTPAIDSANWLCDLGNFRILAKGGWFVFLFYFDINTNFGYGYDK